MKEQTVNTCKICGTAIDLKTPHFILTFNKEAVEDSTKKALESFEGAKICEECGEAGVNAVLRQLKLTLGDRSCLFPSLTARIS